MIFSKRSLVSILLNLLLLGAIVILAYIFFSYSSENFTGLAAIAGIEDSCSMQCRKENGQYVNPENCCECKTSGGFVTGPRNSEDPKFRKCMCDLGSGYESYCYKLTTNFLLSQ